MEFVESSSIGIDVGGSTVDAGLVTQGRADHGSSMIGSVSRIESPSEKPFEEMIRQFGGLIIHAKHEAEESGYQVGVVGIAMPGPFDYENGVSRMEHKFPDANGKNFRHPLEQLAEMPVFLSTMPMLLGSVYTLSFILRKNVF
jgi:glucokinase